MPVRKSRVTSFDVAELAGVSQSTVSRALNGDNAICDATRARVEHAASTLDYRIDQRAARLRNGLTKTIALVVITRQGLNLAKANPFHYNLLGSVCAAASLRGYQALVSFQSEPESFYGDFVKSRQADCMIILGTSTNLAAWQFHRPMLDREDVASWGSPYSDHGRVTSDNHHAGRLAAERLLQGGYRKLAYIGDIDDRQTQFKERYEGFAAALAEAGVEVGLPVVAKGETRTEQGHNAITNLLASGRSFDALFCCCDAIALGALAALSEAGIRVPQQVGVIGFDGLGSGAHTSPPLSTIEPDFTLAGQMLVDVALSNVRAPGHDRIPVRLVERASVL